MIGNERKLEEMRGNNRKLREEMTFQIEIFIRFGLHYIRFCEGINYVLINRGINNQLINN